MRVVKPRTGTLELERLEEQEQTVSSRRRELLSEIDRLRAGVTPSDAQVARLEAIEAQERGLSLERRRLQHLIDGLRLRLRLPEGPRNI